MRSRKNEKKEEQEEREREKNQKMNKSKKEMVKTEKWRQIELKEEQDTAGGGGERCSWSTVKVISKCI